MEKRIWGSDIYTSDSDVVCILQHSGYFEIKELSPTNIQGVSVFFRVSKSRSTYNSTLKNGIKSRKLNNYQGHSIKPEKYTLLVDKFGSQTELLEMASRMPKISLYERHKPVTKKLLDYQSFLEFNICFNSSNELWWAYSLPAIADKGYDFKDYLSWKLKDKVLYIENNQNRFEISRNIFDHLNDDYLFDEFETFRFSKVLEPFEKDSFFMLENSVPLEANLHVKVIYDRLDWHEFQWGEDSLKVKNELLIDKIKAFNFYSMTESKRSSSIGLNGNNLASNASNGYIANNCFLNVGLNVPNSVNAGNGIISHLRNGNNTINEERV